MGHFPPVSTKEVEAVLKHLGFERRKQKATSHVQWVRGAGKDFRKVTVDSNNEPFKDQALAWMLSQMGLKKKEFFKILTSL